MLVEVLYVLEQYIADRLLGIGGSGTEVRYPVEVHRGQGFKRRHVPAADHDHVGFTALIIAGPFLDPEPGSAVLDRLVHGQPLLNFTNCLPAQVP